MMMSDLFSNINISTTTLTNGVMPVIGIIGLSDISISILSDSDFFILEKYEIPKTDTATIAIIEDIITDQSLTYHMYFSPDNEWRSEYTYYISDIVHHQGQLYTATADHISSPMEDGVSGFTIDVDAGLWTAGGSVTGSDYIYRDYWTESTLYPIDTLIVVTDSAAPSGVYRALSEHTSSVRGLFDGFYIDLTDGKWEITAEEAYYVETIADYSYTYAQYMTSMYYMSDNAIDYIPQFIDIRKYFEGGLSYIIDNTADIITNKYIYRILTRYNGSDYASYYISGIQPINYEIQDNPEIAIDGVTISNGDLQRVAIATGDLQRTTYDDIIIRGLPIYVPSLRYKGVIEADKLTAFIGDIDRSLTWISNSIDTIDNKCVSMLSSMEITTVG
jgi:hypothetical protein